jgi:hypothetical protein
MCTLMDSNGALYSPHNCYGYTWTGNIGSGGINFYGCNDYRWDSGYVGY